MEQEQTFMGNCQICGSKNTQCRNHHFVPRRLLKTLPIHKMKEWQYMKAVVCNTCNKYFHPENHLYQRIEFLENELRKNGIWKDIE